LEKCESAVAPLDAGSAQVKRRWTGGIGNGGGGYDQRIRHDTFGYASIRMNPEQLRRAAICINRKLERGKAFEFGASAVKQDKATASLTSFRVEKESP
jgi:hypothetical protein